MIDEKRRRSEIEGKFEAVQAQVNEQELPLESEYSVRGNTEDLLKLQNHLAIVY